MVGILKKVLKGVMKEKGFENEVMEKKVLGGNGYIEEKGMRKYVRDERIEMIYEGEKGIKEIEIVGSKMEMKGGREINELLKEVGEL